ncbi:TetR family transcriptional regulator C-terminal domain-containing protein [Streptomyces sp. NPDC058424]|uniref:TetR family transcriptional regulator C-terminal domain-containing protein n=1 Tax=Streptomyces sp. NPDC058424 TaxID=3346491 RepID=UPI00366221C6
MARCSRSVTPSGHRPCSSGWPRTLTGTGTCGSTTGTRGEQGTDETFARGQAQRYEAWHHQIRHLTERGVAEGEFTCDDLDGVTVRFAALADGLALQHLRQTPADDGGRPPASEPSHRDGTRAKAPAPGASCV